ncbi:MAG TPA: hypothetical protein H9903_18085 [Candidatus Aquabacterium excrementipullorum]|nr:hypothetical protein [Candidatus Aquabacterium excrementipullorum]
MSAGTADTDIDTPFKPDPAARWRHAGLAIVMSTMLAACAGPQAEADATPVPQGVGEETTIAFANQGGVQNWQPAGDTALLLQDQRGQWYVARLQAPAIDLPFTENLGFDTDPSGSFGRLNAVVIRGVRYPVISLKRTEPPAKKK